MRERFGAERGYCVTGSGAPCSTSMGSATSLELDLRANGSYALWGAATCTPCPGYDSAAGYEVDFPQECFDARACCLF